MASLQRLSKSESQTTDRKDSAQDPPSKRLRSSTTTVATNTESNKIYASTTATTYGSNNDGVKNIQPTDGSTRLSILTPSKTKGTVSEGSRSFQTRRGSGLIGLRKMLSRTGAFVKEVCQAEIGDARGVNAYLEKSRSRDEKPLKRVHHGPVATHEWARAQAEWMGFSCSNSPIVEKMDPFAHVQWGGAPEQGTKKEWWQMTMTRQKSCYVLPHASIYARPAALELRQLSQSISTGPTEPGPSNWLSSLPASQDPSRSNSLQAPTHDRILLITLLTATRHYYQSRLLQTYGAYLPKKVGKRNDSCTPTYSISAVQGKKWNAILWELRREREVLARWEHDRQIRHRRIEIAQRQLQQQQQRQSSRRFWRMRGRHCRKSSSQREVTEMMMAMATATVEPMAPRPLTPWLAELEKIVRELHARGVCPDVRTNWLDAWIETFLHVTNRSSRASSKDKTAAASDEEDEDDEGTDGVNAEEEGDETDGEMRSVRIEDLVEKLEFEQLALLLTEDLVLVQWVFEGGSGVNNIRSEDDASLQKEIQAAIERVRKEWFRIIFMQDACVLDGYAMGLPARVYKVLSEKALRKKTERLREIARIRKEENKESGKGRRWWYLWDREEGKEAEEQR